MRTKAICRAAWGRQRIIMPAKSGSDRRASAVCMIETTSPPLSGPEFERAPFADAAFVRRPADRLNGIEFGGFGSTWAPNATIGESHAATETSARKNTG